MHFSVLGLQRPQGLFPNHGDEAKSTMFKFSLFRKTGKRISIEYRACGQQYFLMSNLHFENNLDSRSFVLQREYILAKPARDAAAKAKMEAEGASVTEVPVHEDNEWNIRYKVAQFYLLHFRKF